MHILASSAFLVSVAILFVAGLFHSRLNCFYGAAILLFGGMLIALTWADQCTIFSAVQLRCNAKAATFFGMGVGLILRCLIPLTARERGN